jgi:class 3 adenylate cyclase
MQQIADWLKKLGMSEYTDRFVENRIDISVLPDLTEQHLKDLGIALGDRLKMLRAIRDLSNVSVAVTAPSVPTATEPTRRDDAERRQLTVMFTDLVGSTALSTRLDPEDMRSLIGAYHKCVAETVARFDGFVAKYMGDGVLVYFGYPQAHEDDPERAVRAGLGLIDAVGKLQVQEPLQVRIGVATGLVVVGDLVGSGEAQERGVVGETPNLAARLQGIAAPNTVVIAEGTRRLLGNLFELEDLRPKDLKGIAGPARAWAVVRARSVESRFEALHTSGLTALVGREEEIELLLRRWSKAKSGEGQVVLLAGEAGIGKSRLTAALMEGLAAEPHTRLRYFCSPQHTDSAFYPIIGQMERAAGLAHDDTPRAKLDKLDTVLAQTSTSIEDAALFAEMLSLPNDGRYPTLDLTPQQRRQRTLEAVISQLEGLARQSPVLIVFEDAHWADPTTLELLGRVVDRIETLRVLLIVMFRPEFDPPWIGRSHVTAVTLNRLTQRQVGAMIDGVVGNKLLPASVRQDIIERTDGIPLFVEEMAKAVLEAEDEGAARHTVAAVPSPALAIPASLHASLMARLDRLGPAKEVAQIGAAIGREFSYALLASVVRKPEAELVSVLNRLVQAGLLFRNGAPPHATYLFKHALVQDAAYGTLLREPRRALHARIADVLERKFVDIAESQPELLAHHSTEARLIEKAVVYWLKAGRQSLARSAMAEASAQLRNGLEVLAGLPDSPWRREQELELLIALRPALAGTKGYAAVDVGEIIARARTLAKQTNRAEYLLPLTVGQWQFHLIRSEHRQALSLAEQIEQIGEARNDMAAQLQGRHTHGWTRCLLGEFVPARALQEQRLGLSDPAHRSVRGGLSEDPYASMLAHLAVTLAYMGYIDEARSRLDHRRPVNSDTFILWLTCSRRRFG